MLTPIVFAHAYCLQVVISPECVHQVYTLMFIKIEMQLCLSKQQKNWCTDWRQEVPE